MTLIEVLIASIILFMALGLVGVVYQQNFDTQRRTQQYLKEARVMQSLMAAIRFALQQGESEGKLNMVGMPYSWKAKLIEAKPEINSVSPETGLPESGSGKLHLFSIEVTNENTQHDFEFKQAVWLSNRV
ncbi:PulJ/GspJ family protein [Shewanella algidipiscicola]|uniref:PulJ/GspJ family protein n=1 Tax=Shewanella algidipiscicola TaxID=614070 RepID=UPI000D783545|nr:hypothetical protein [Shewanella algidipiscicola]